MYIKYFISCSFTLLAISAQVSAQNMVINGGFEPVDCPSPGTTLFEIAPPWNEPHSVVEHYGPCSDPGGPNYNNNVAPQEGDGYIGLSGYGQFNVIYNREYALGRLVQPLQAGQRYRVSYWVHPVVVQNSNINAGINGPDVLFFENANDFTGLTDPQFYYSSDSALHPEEPITRTDQWTQVCLNFVAVGYERYVALGTFRLDDEVTAVGLNGAPTPELGYYLIDNLVVEPIDEPVLPSTAEICPDGELTLSVPDGLFGTWDDGSTNPERVVAEPGTYTYGYQDGICFRVDQVVVEEVNCTRCAVYIPTAFTPNSDGTNDEWAPKFDCDIIEYRVEVYDRIGNRVFETFDVNATWMPDQSVAQGTYVARIRFTYELFGDRTIVDRTSEVTLLR